MGDLNHDVQKQQERHRRRRDAQCLEQARRDPGVVLQDRSWWEADAALLYFDLCEHVAETNPDALPEFAAYAQTLALIVGDPHLEVRVLRLQVQVLDVLGLPDAVADLHRQYQERAAACCEPCRESAQRFAGQRSGRRRFGSATPEVEALTLVTACESLSFQKLKKPRRIVQAIVRLAFVVARSGTGEKQALRALDVLAEKLKGRDGLTEVREASRWLAGLCHARLRREPGRREERQRLAQLRFDALRGHYLKRGRVRKALALTIDGARNYNERFHGSVAESKLLECVEALDKEDALRKRVERAATVVCGAPADEAYRCLQQLRAELDVEMPDLLEVEE
jgi:hypothetical protein